MKFNWGKGLFTAYAIFIAGVLIMVSISISGDVDLVTPDYYDKEIKYGEEINRKNNTGKLTSAVNFEVSENSVRISFPAGTSQSEIKGEILFYRPSESKKDFKTAISAAEERTQLVDISGIDKGLWKIKVLWSSDGTDYLSETSFIKQ